MGVVVIVGILVCDCGGEGESIGVVVDYESGYVGFLFG